MAWYPGATRRPVARFNPGGAQAVRITPRRGVFHTAVSGARSLFDYFNQPGNPCSTWYVAADGYCEQYVDSDYRAPTQLEGNHDCLSWESQDMGDGFPAWTGSNVPAWTAAQVDRLADISAWVNQIHGIPLVQLPDSVNGRTGLGYHRLGINPWRVANGELWSNATGKVCPGDRRIAQVPQVIARAIQITQGDDDVLTQEQATQLANINWGVNDPAQGLRTMVASVQVAVAPLADDEAEIKEAIAAIPPPPPVDVDALAAALAPLLPAPVVDVPADLAGQIAADLMNNSAFLAAIAVAVVDLNAQRLQD